MKRKSKRFLAWLLSAALIVSLLPCMAVQAETSINIGEYVQMGTYYGEPILWRCVDIDENGPLMLSDKIICIKPFDAAGDDTSGSHGRGRDGKYRKKYGSNYWADSNIRCWLNSDASAGNVEWACGNPPIGEKLSGSYNYTGYASESGFLTNFTVKERNAIKLIAQKSLLDGFEYTSQHINENYYTLNLDNFSTANINNILQNYNTAYSEQVTDLVFLLDIKQVKTIYDNRNILGFDYYIGQPTEECVAYSDYHGCSSTDKWVYWLRSPATSSALHLTGVEVYTINNLGDISVNIPHCNYAGVRPAFYLNLLSSSFTSGNGTESSPYTVDGSGSYTPATEAPTPTPTPQPLSLKIYCNEPSLSTTVGNVFTVGAAMQDDNGNYGSPEDITFDIEDESILRAVKTTDDGETRQLTFNALKEGTTVIKIKDKSTGQKGELPFTVNKANGNAYTIYNVPNLGDDKKANFNNFSGLYVDSFKVNRQGNGSAVVSFDVYNKNYTSASVEVYNADGEMTDAEVIDKCDFETSISDTFGTMFNIGKDIWNGVYNPLSYKSSIQSKHTPIKNLTIPRGGYLKITPDTRESAVCGASNGLDIIGQVMSLSGDIMDVSSMKKKKGDIAKTVTEKLKDGGKEFMEAYSKGMTTEISNRTLASRSDVKEFIGAINDIFSQGDMKELAVSVFTDSAVDLGKSSAEEWFTKNSGPAGKALSGFFKFSEIDNLIMQASDFAKKANKGGIIIQAPDGSTRRCSDVTVNCKMNDNTALDVYRLDKNSIEIRQAKKAYPTKLGSSIEGYNITLSENGEERQPEGKAEVTIDIPSYMSGSKNIAVYRLEKNGSITDMNGEVTGSTVTFETDHFSTYLLTEDGKENELPELKEGQTVVNGDTIVSDWAAKEVQEAFDENLVPDVLRGADLTKRVDRAEFAAIAVTLYEKLSSAKAQAGNNPFGDISDSVCKEDILKAYSLGITNGITDTRFEPSTLISREQVATMLTRAYKKSEFPSWTLETDGKYPLNYMGVTRYADDDEISDYAKESVYFMTRWDILNGVDDSHFAPKNNTTLGESYGYATREQAVVIALRSAKHL